MLALASIVYMLIGYNFSCETIALTEPIHRHEQSRVGQTAVCVCKDTKPLKVFMYVVVP